MSRTQEVIITNMCMVYDDKGRILILDRKKEDWPGVTFPGGHVEPGESFVESAIREVYEETGLTIENPILCGIKQFQEDDSPRYMVLLFKTNKFTGEIKNSPEGQVYWIERNDLKNYNLSIDFEAMVEIFEKDQLSEFYYYKNQDQDWEYKIL